jgi:hypothetical protein
MVDLLYPVHDESVVARSVENLYWQFLKSKAQKRYEFGSMASVATTSKNNWTVGADALQSLL